MVTPQLSFCPDARIKVTRKERREIAGFAVAKEQLLRGHGTRGVHVEGKPGLVPAPQSRAGILVDMALQYPFRVALGPDQTLQGFKGRPFPIFVHEAFQGVGHGVEVA